MSSGSKSFVLVPRGLHDCGGHRLAVCSNQKRNKEERRWRGLWGFCVCVCADERGGNEISQERADRAGSGMI